MFWNRVARPLKSQRMLRAGPLLIDRTEKRARLGATTIELSPLLFRLLDLIASRPGKLISRQEIKAELWSYAERIDTERRLNTAMVALREALGDNADAPRLIATVRGEGYRWVGGGEARKWLGSTAAGLTALTIAAAAVFGTAPIQTPGDPVMTMRAQAAVDAWRNEPSAERLESASAQVRNAERDSPNQPSVLVLKAQLALESRWDWEGSEGAYRRALRLDPSNADAKLGLAWLEVNRGNQEQALTYAEQLLESAVVSGDRRAELGWLLIRIGRPDLAVAACTGNPSPSRNDLSCAHTAWFEQKDFEKARSAALQLMRGAHADARDIQAVAQLPANIAYATFLDWRARHFLPKDAPWFQRAQVLADAGMNEGALRALERSVAAREPLAIKIGSSPSFRLLRSDPRFQRLATQVGVKP